MSMNYSQSNEPTVSFMEESSTAVSDHNMGVPFWDTSDPFVSAQTRDTMTVVFKCYIRQTIVFIGIPGNVLCCLVFLKQGLSDRVNLLLFSLAVADLTHLSAQMLYSARCYMGAPDSLQATNWDTLVYTKISYVSLWSTFVSGALVAIMSMDRCLSVAAPLRARRLVNYRLMLAAIIFTYLIHLACFLPILLVFTVKWRMDPLTNRSIAYMAFTDWFTLDRKVPEDIVSVLTLTVKPISFVIVVVCCTITIITLRQASRKRIQMTGNAKEEREKGEDRITKMLLFLCVIYVVLVLPEISSSLTFNFVPGFFLYKKYHNTFVVVFEVLINTASCINSTANFFVYLVLSSRFRTTFKKLCH